MPDGNGTAPAETQTNVSKATILSFIAELEEAESELGDAVAACKPFRKKIRAINKRIGDAGINAVAFRRMREDLEKPGIDRDEEQRHYATYMQYLGKPANFQGAFVFSEGDEAEQAALADIQKNRIRDHAKVAGRGGGAREENPWVPSTEEHVLWDSAWRDGHDEWLAEQTAIAESMATDAPKRRGRPPGSGKRQRNGSADEAKL